MQPIATDQVAQSVCLSVCLSVCHDSEPCKNSRTDRHAIWGVDSGGPTEACIRWGAHRRYLANTDEPSMCGGDAVLCQITLTICY